MNLEYKKVRLYSLLEQALQKVEDKTVENKRIYLKELVKSPRLIARKLFINKAKRSNNQVKESLKKVCNLITRESKKMIEDLISKK